MTIPQTDNLATLQEIRRGWLDEKRCLLSQLDTAREGSATYLALLNKRYHEEQQQRQAHISMLEANLGKLALDLAELDQRIAELAAGQSHQ